MQEIVKKQFFFKQQKIVLTMILRNIFFTAIHKNRFEITDQRQIILTCNLLLTI